MNWWMAILSSIACFVTAAVVFSATVPEANMGGETPERALWTIILVGIFGTAGGILLMAGTIALGVRIAQND